MSVFERFNAIDNDPKLLSQFVRECVLNFCEHGDDEQLVIARRVMIRLSQQSDDAIYWTVRHQKFMDR